VTRIRWKRSGLRWRGGKRRGIRPRRVVMRRLGGRIAGTWEATSGKPTRDFGRGSPGRAHPARGGGGGQADEKNPERPQTPKAQAQGGDVGLCKRRHLARRSGIVRSGAEVEGDDVRAGLHQRHVRKQFTGAKMATVPPRSRRPGDRAGPTSRGKGEDFGSAAGPLDGFASRCSHEGNPAFRVRTILAARGGRHRLPPRPGGPAADWPASSGGKRSGQVDGQRSGGVGPCSRWARSRFAVSVVGGGGTLGTSLWGGRDVPAAGTTATKSDFAGRGEDVWREPRFPAPSVLAVGRFDMGDVRGRGPTMPRVKRPSRVEGTFYLLGGSCSGLVARHEGVVEVCAAHEGEKEARHRFHVELRR